jgi:hypothetical protein
MVADVARLTRPNYRGSVCAHVEIGRAKVGLRREPVLLGINFEMSHVAPRTATWLVGHCRG